MVVESCHNLDGANYEIYLGHKCWRRTGFGQKYYFLIKVICEIQLLKKVTRKILVVYKLIRSPATIFDCEYGLREKLKADQVSGQRRRCLMLLVGPHESHVKVFMEAQPRYLF